MTCPSCGHENSEAAKFCEECGSPLEARQAAREQRKTVTVLFCDITGSTALGESTDPEALRAVLARYFERMKSILESHGASVEKFIGDAVMAVFGVPQVHEDDALRACRAAIEMRDALPELGLQARIGLNTGEVVTGTEERLATGDAVNVAARLEQAAPAGEILIGEPTLALVRDAVETEQIEALALKGKAEPVPAYRLAAVTGEVARRHEARFVGREQELGALRQAWEGVLDTSSCSLVTVIGHPGVGKSRLVAEFLAMSGARAVQGRCLSYGEGITYWPVVGVMKQLDALPSDPAADAALRSLLEETHDATSADEIAWAFRKLLEEQAPVVCVFDDIHWGEQTFLDLIDHVALLSTGAPILLLCLARPELTERRPQWPITLRLDPLPGADVDALIPVTVPDQLRARIVRAAGGNPLFVTEMVAMAREAEGDVAVPPNLKALLAARLDQLDQPERSVLERGAVEGELFHRTAVQALSENGQVAPRLAALVRKELVRPDKPQLAGDDAFRFRHLLIRDAAYDALSKATRAELHERFAVWLDRHADLVELDEIVGYHLEQAARYKQELGTEDRDLAVRAADRLAPAGRRALWRGDIHAARSLLERALDLSRSTRFDVHLELDLADSYLYIPRRFAELTAATVERARQEGDELAESVALVVDAFARTLMSHEDAAHDCETYALAVLPLLEEGQDHVGLARVWAALSYGAYHYLGRYEKMADAAERSVRHARLAGRGSFRLAGLPGALSQGPRPADEALETLDSLLSANSQLGVVFVRAGLIGMLGRLDEAWSLALPAAARWRELGGEAEHHDTLAEIALYEGDHAKAAEYCREMCDMLERRGSRGFLSTYAPLRGRSLCALGQYDEAEPLAALGRELGAEDDFITQMLWRQVQALVHAHRGEHVEAERLALEAVAVGETTDALNWQGDAYSDLAEVLAAAGRIGEATDALERALDCFERKKNLAMVAQVRPKLEELRARVS